jgi:hypothetical protein
LYFTYIFGGKNEESGMSFRVTTVLELTRLVACCGVTSEETQFLVALRKFCERAQKTAPAKCEALNFKAVGMCQCDEVYKPPVYAEAFSSFVLNEAQKT